MGLGTIPLAVVATAQQQTPAKTDIEHVPRATVEARHAAGKPLYDTQWVVDASGAVMQFPNPAAGGSTDAGLPFLGQPHAGRQPDPLPEELRAWLRSWKSALPWLAANLRQPGSLLGAIDAERHRTQLGLQTAPTDVRLLLLLTEAIDRGLPDVLQRRALLEREVAARLLQQTNCLAARGEFEALRREADPFLVHAANDALAAMGARAAAVPTTPWTATPPTAGIDAWFWLDLRHFAPRPDIATAVRRATAEDFWQQLLAIGADPINLALAGAQMIVDRPGEAPFELARCWGRARIDRCLLGLSVLDGKTQLGWAEATGMFEVEALRTYLTERGLDVGGNGPVQSGTWWEGFHVTVTADRVVVLATAMAKQVAGPMPEVLAAAIAKGAAFAAALPAESPIESLPWLLLERGENAQVSLAPFTLRVSTAGDAAAARSRCDHLARELSTVAKTPGSAPHLPDSALRSWLDALQNPIATKNAAGTMIEVTGEGLDPFALWPLLR